MEERMTAYEAPVVTNYGDFRELTGWKGSTGTEDGCQKTEDGNFSCSDTM